MLDYNLEYFQLGLFWFCVFGSREKMFEDIVNQNPVIEDKPKPDFDKSDAEVIEKLKNGEINVDEVCRNLEKWYKGKITNY